MGDNGNEGWPGTVIDEVRGRAEAALPQQYRSNAYLVNAGTNDCMLDIDIPGAGGRMGAPFDYLYGAAAEATVLLALHAAAQRHRGRRRARRRGQRAAQAPRRGAPGRRSAHRAPRLPGRGRPSPSTTSQDITFPSNEGYGKMVRIWFDGLLDVDTGSFLQEAV
ncbi:hypothetical protein DL768_008584 [Monosporascus sp. mg162]|nr:hypothetical protein DL768_008584 [Monosporascus sp. mg162]